MSAPFTMATVSEEQRQLVMLALAQLCARRPGWHYALKETAQQFQSVELFENFLALARIDDVEEVSGIIDARIGAERAVRS